MQNILVQLIFSGLSLLAAPPGVEEKSWTDANGIQHVVQMYSEEALTFVDEFIVAPNTLPERLNHKTFTDIELARDYFHKYKRGTLPVLSHLSEIQTETLWPVTESWNWDWELRYAQWVEQKVNKKIFYEHHVATDCADVASGFRWIFAREHGLPVANTLAITHVLFTQDTMKAEWLNLPTAKEWYNDQRFLAVLDYLFKNSYTHTLIMDSYPIAINTESVLPGVHHLKLTNKSGHTLFIKNVDLSASASRVLTTLASTVPRAVRLLNEGGYYSFSQPTGLKKGGFLRLRWPVKQGEKWALQAASLHPGYSLEQYEPNFMHGYSYFHEAVEYRLNPAIEPETKLQTMSEDLWDRYVQRHALVVEGYHFCLMNDCSPDTEAYEDWSTPSRDQAIKDLITQIDRFIDLWVSQKPQLQTYWTQFQNQHEVEVDGENKALHIINEKFRRDLISSDPRDSIGKRWGF